MIVCTAFIHTDPFDKDTDPFDKEPKAMLSAISYRSLSQAKAARADIKVLAAGSEEDQKKAVQMMKDATPDSGIGYMSTLPKVPGEDLNSALLTKDEHQYEHVHDYSDAELAIAATMIAADLIYTGGFDEPAVFKNLDVFIPAMNERGRGFCNERLFSMVPWFATLGQHYGVFFDAQQQLVMHEGWCIFPDADDDKCIAALYDASRFESALQMVSYRLNAFDVQMAGTRRTMCSGYLMRSFFTFFSQMPNFIIPKYPEFGSKMPGYISVGSETPETQGPGSSSQVPAKRSRKEEDE